MSTRDPIGIELPGSLAGAPPEELRVSGAQLPTAGTTPTGSAPTPGIALAAARVPGSPTLPDWDPSSLTSLVSRLANEMFGAPPPAAPPAAPTQAAAPAPGVVAAPAAPAQPSAFAPAAPAQAAVPAPAAPTPAQSAFVVPDAQGMPSPFTAPLSFAGIGAIDAPWTMAFPLVEVTPPEPLDSPPLERAESVAAPSVPAVPAQPALQPARAPEPPPAQPAPEPVVPDGGIAAAPYEIRPITDATPRPSAGSIFDPVAIRREFPILQEIVNGKRLVWLDNAATTQKPRAVIDRLSSFYERENSNIHRAAHTLAARATDAYESARETARRFLNAPSAKEIIFVRGTTEGINLVAQSWGRRNVGPGDEIVITWLEHHANIVPWQQLCSEKGARLRVAPVDDRGQVILEEYEKLLGPRTRIVAFSQVSNALGTITPAREMIALAHRHGAKVMLDGAQAVSHMRVDVQLLDCDFYVFSGHKVFAPTGIGVVFGKGDLLEAMPPWQGGGNMIQDVTFERTVFQGAPARFEAGTGSIADAVGLGAALDWLTRVGIENVGRHEHDLLVYGTEQLATVPGLTMIGTAPDKAGVLSFVLAGQKTEEVGGLLDKEGIAVRSGHHCAQPILRRFGLEASVRASLAPYNTCEDIDALVAALRRLQAGHGALGYRA